MCGYETSTEKELVLLYSEGDTSALNVLFARIRPYVFSVVNNYIGDWDRAEDYTQEVLIKVKLNIDNKKYLPNGNFYSWLLCITKNYVGDDLRHRKRYGLDYHYNIDSCREINFFQSEDIEERLFSEFQSNLIRKIIHLLPYNQMQIIQYRYYQELSFKEIATMLNISINTALGRCRYGIQNLRKLYNKFEQT